VKVKEDYLVVRTSPGFRKDATPRNVATPAGEPLMEGGRGYRRGGQIPPKVDRSYSVSQEREVETCTSRTPFRKARKRRRAVGGVQEKSQTKRTKGMSIPSPARDWEIPPCCGAQKRN